MKQQLVDELRKQGYSRIADLLDAEPERLRVADGVFAVSLQAPTHEHDWIMDAPSKKKAK